MDKRVNELSKLSDAELAALANKNDTDAFFAIEIRYQERVFRHVLRSVFNIPLAQDITGETFDAALYRFAKHEYIEQGKLLNWLFTIARKIHATRIRKTSVHPSLDIDDGFNISEETPSLSQREQFLRIGKAIRTCTHRERIPFILYFVKLKNWKEIGRRLGIKPESARKDAYRCHVHVLKALGRYKKV
jgi:RNA polymerase sigma factor (sigma-70 family)